MWRRNYRETQPISNDRNAWDALCVSHSKISTMERTKLWRLKTYFYNHKKVCGICISLKSISYLTDTALDMPQKSWDSHENITETLFLAYQLTGCYQSAFFRSNNNISSSKMSWSLYYVVFSVTRLYYIISSPSF
jgi:hypothetical protein